MRAAAILGPRASLDQVRLFRLRHAEVQVEWQLHPSQDYDAVLVFGGDGTVHRHLKTLAGVNRPVLVVPCGSGNDFARALGLRSRSAALGAWQQFCAGAENVRRIDLGVITPLPAGASSSSTYFCCVGGAGLDSITNRRANALPSWLRSRGGYVASLLREVGSFRPPRITVSIPDRAITGNFVSRISEAAMLVAFGNAPSYGGGMQIAPKADLEDGRLDVCFVRQTGKLRLLRVFPIVFSGSHLTLPEVEYFQTCALRLEAEQPIEVYADGEYVCSTPIEVRVEARPARNHRLARLLAGPPATPLALFLAIG